MAFLVLVRPPLVVVEKVTGKRFTALFRANAAAGARRFTWILLAIVALAIIECVAFWLLETGRMKDLNSPADAAWAILLYIVDRAMLEQPVSWPGRTISVFVIIQGLFLFGVLISEITAIRVKGGDIMEDTMPENHVLVCGWTRRTEGVIRGLAPARHESGTGARCPVVLIVDLPEDSKNDDEKQKKTRQDIDELRRERDFRLVHGDPTDAGALRKAGVMEANSAIILADDGESDPDMHTLLVVLAIETLNRKVHTCAEVYRAENKAHFERAHVDETICVDELGCHVTASASVSHWVSRLVCEMLTLGPGQNQCFRVEATGRVVGRRF